MAQHDMNIANQGFPAFRSDLNNALSAIQTNHSGTSRPSGAVAGQIWLDTTNATSPTLKFFDGTDDISLATIDYSANTVNWLDSTVSVTGLATTATGTVLTLSDTATTQTVNFIIDNEKEIRFSEADGNGSNYVALKAPASLASDVTFTLPSADGTADQVLKTDGSGNLSFTDVSGGISWQSSIVTGSTLTAVAGNGYWIDTTSNTCTITLPASASVGDQIIFVDYARTWNTNKIIIDSNGLNYQGDPDTFTLEYNTNGQTVNIVYSGATKGWIPVSDDDVTDSPIPPSYDIDFLVIAGGGGGGSDAFPSTPGGGGGGAGGYRTSTQTVAEGTVITVTVGDGGNGGVAGSSGTKTSGSDSSISGSGLTTITSTGGGHGAAYNSYAAATGGSGGGGSFTGGGAGYAGAAGNTPSTSPSQGNNGGDGSNSNQAGGGGGGAGGAGGVPSASTAGAGGSGTASSITGSSVTRAGGGGGGGGYPSINNGGTASGGGGAGGGQNTQADGVSGTANTGGGGGGGAAQGSSGDIDGDGGNGGKGVVILSMLDADYSGTTTGSPTVDTGVSGKTILTFNGSGSYTT